MILALDFETANGDAGSICSVGIASLGGGGEIEREEILQPFQLFQRHDSRHPAGYGAQRSGVE